MRHALLFALLLLCGEARAVVLDWTTATWANGALTNSYDIDATNPGADITITVSGDTGRLRGGFPRVDTGITGGISPADDNLRSSVDFANTTQQLTVTITFNYPDLVKDATFTLFNLGNSGTKFQDQVRSIIGTDGTTQYAANITNLGSSVQLAGSGTGQTLTGIAVTANNSPNGNATIDFGTNKINQITYVFGSAPSATANPRTQQIGLFDISFAPVVPEVGSSFGALAVASRCFSRRGAGDRLSKRRWSLSCTSRGALEWGWWSVTSGHASGSGRRTSLPVGNAPGGRVPPARIPGKVQDTL